MPTNIWKPNDRHHPFVPRLAVLLESAHFQQQHLQKKGRQTKETAKLGNQTSQKPHLRANYGNIDASGGRQRGEKWESWENWEEMEGWDADNALRRGTLHAAHTHTPSLSTSETDLHQKRSTALDTGTAEHEREYDLQSARTHTL